ncbi:membrane-bound lytic murein transglycosylase D [Pseudidiomarina indica]|uniref:Membrane-bound lytic murein transglycosylase D n=1 Tax=Pseudidiomarina indica TaxID=1159017 RepID=A0A1G6AXU1_9GAMM|nr:LysM peptidoglycan-binding domain-containing protein [Pseudidiomarina indica]SDB13182.1 membrane-bound lytic murein transglycosylase D [Pseudidiomarina indica]
MKKWLALAISTSLFTGCATLPWQSEQQPTDTTAAPLPVADEPPSIDVAEALVEPTPETVTPISPQQEADVWVRIKRQLTLDAPEVPRLVSQREWYLNNPHYMERVAKRAQPFMYFIVEEIERRNMPLELALLPIVESAFDPFAYSHGRAAGIWQFIPGTARHYGLEINWWYDGRRDVYAATHAALDYLDALQKRFDGDWLHALAAYNSGEGRVANAIRANQRAGKPTDFWSLQLPLETRAYVPKLLALADILKNHDDYAQHWLPIDNAPYLAIVEAPAQIDLAKAAEMAELDLDELHHYNSAYNRWATDPSGPHRLLLPIENANKLQHWLANTDQSELVQWARHQVKPGESLLVIAKQYHTTAKAIQQANRISGHIIRAGDYLLVPVATRELDDYTLSAEQRLASKQSTARGEYKVEHTVVKGDTLWDISRKYKVNLRQLASWNGMAPTDPLRPGKTLVVWLPHSEQPAGVVRSVNYKVRSGDSLARIASRFNVRIQDIEKWNQISRNNYLQPGQELKLLVDVTRLNSQS